MAEAAIIEAIRKYLSVLPERGIHSRRAILFGSHAKGTADQWSDIDLIVLAPEFDRRYSRELETELWRASGRVDSPSPIQPIGCGEIEWETDDGQPLLEIARREGIEISA
ncbi:MAG: nucleotidyltransferase domain-containing protein [Candidatus Hydrogenedentes bacterium]|nr:nucleotidyltransferase domain-containing protein [Candidatus Hydrogenedentota bacterium]